MLISYQCCRHQPEAMRAYVQRMEHKILEALEASKQEYLAEQYENVFQGLQDELNSAAHRMDDFIGSLENRIADFEVRMEQEAKVNTKFRSGIQHHLDISHSDISQQEGFEIISVVEDTPFVFATPYRRPSTKEEKAPLCPKEAARDEEKPPGTCLWPRNLFRRRDPTATLD